jgi:exonuclease III
MRASVNGLRSKLDVLSVLTEAKRPSFLTIQETKISNKIVIHYPYLVTCSTVKIATKTAEG